MSLPIRPIFRRPGTEGPWLPASLSKQTGALARGPKQASIHRSSREVSEGRRERGGNPALPAPVRSRKSRNQDVKILADQDEPLHQAPGTELRLDPVCPCRERPPGRQSAQRHPHIGQKLRSPRLKLGPKRGGSRRGTAGSRPGRNTDPPRLGPWGLPRKGRRGRRQGREGEPIRPDRVETRSVATFARAIGTRSGRQGRFRDAQGEREFGTMREDRASI